MSFEVFETNKSLEQRGRKTQYKRQ